MSKKILFLCIVLLMVIVPGLKAQELTGVKAQRVNKRYEITYDLYKFGWDESYDIYIYARQEGAKEWFKAKALVGPYQSVASRNEYTVLWEPVLDYKPYEKYDFKLYAVNQLYTKTIYSYETTEEIGLLHFLNQNPTNNIYIGEQKLTASVPIALPVGVYDVSLRTGTNIRNRSIATVEAMKYNELELIPQEGFLTLSSNEPGVKFFVKGFAYTKVERLTLPVGECIVEAELPDALKYLGLPKREARVVIELGKETKLSLDFPIGYLTLTSNESRVGYTIDSVYRGNKVEKFKLAEGTHLVTAKNEANTKGFYNNSLESEVVIKAGEETVAEINFAYGYLTLRNNLPGCVYSVDGIPVDLPERLKLPVGKHVYRAEYIHPYSPIVKNFSLSPNDNLIESLRFVKDKELIRGERRKQFHSLFATLPLSNIRMEHNFKLDESNRLSYQNYDYNPVSNSITVSGFQFKDFFRFKSKRYDDLDDIDDPFVYFGVGVIDKFMLGNEIGNDQTAYLIDWLSGIAGIGFLNKAGTIYTTLEGKMLWSGQSPLFRNYSLGDTTYTYVHGFVDYVPGEDAAEGSEPDRYIHQFVGNQFGLEANLEIGVRLSSWMFMYGFAGLRYQSDLGGGWYLKSSVDSWENYNSDEPNRVYDPRLPDRNALMEGTTYRIGVGIGFPFSRKTYTTIFG